jgi:RNA polymerase sigma-70 factor (ECF subfamily)
MVAMDPAFERIMDRCREGDRDAFDEVVSRYGLQVLRTARLIVRDEQLAEDVTQETFIRAWRNLHGLRDEDPGPWLLRIATNESISAWRRRHRFEALAQRFARLGPESAKPSSEDRVDLSRALSRLSPDLRAAVVLHYYQDLSVEETAHALGQPVDTVKSRLKVALRRLRELTGGKEEWQ